MTCIDNILYLLYFLRNRTKHNMCIFSCECPFNAIAANWYYCDHVYFLFHEHIWYFQEILNVGQRTHCVTDQNIIIIIITRLVTRHMSIALKRWIAGADGLPWWSPSQVLDTIYCVCSVYEFICVLPSRTYCLRNRTNC